MKNIAKGRLDSTKRPHDAVDAPPHFCFSAIRKEESGLCLFLDGRLGCVVWKH